MLLSFLREEYSAKESESRQNQSIGLYRCCERVSISNTRNSQCENAKETNSILRAVSRRGTKRSTVTSRCCDGCRQTNERTMRCQSATGNCETGHRLKVISLRTANRTCPLTRAGCARSDWVGPGWG